MRRAGSFRTLEALLGAAFRPPTLAPSSIYLYTQLGGSAIADTPPRHLTPSLGHTRSLWGLSGDASTVPWPTQSSQSGAAVASTDALLSDTDQAGMPSNGTSSSTSSSTSTSTSEDSLGTADPWQQHASSAQGDAPLVWAADDSAAQAASSLATDALDASALAAAHAHAWPTTSLALEGLALGHNTLGLPWWASIAAFSLTVRLLVMFPLKYVLEKRRRMLQLDEMAISHNEPTAVSEDERPDAEFRLTEEFAEMSAEEKAEHARMAEAIMKEYGPRERTLVLQMNMPSTVRSITWLSMLGGVSALMAAEVPSMSSGGALWFTDLTVPDTTLGLTMLSGALLLKATREWRLLFLKKDPSPFHVRSISFFNDLHRFVALAMVLIPAGFYLPAGTMLLGLFDGSLAMVQNRVVRTIVDHQVLMGSSSFAAFHKKQEDDNASAPPPPGDAPPSAGPGSPGG